MARCGKCPFTLRSHCRDFARCLPCLIFVIAARPPPLSLLWQCASQLYYFHSKSNQSIWEVPPEEEHLIADTWGRLAHPEKAAAVLGMHFSKESCGSGLGGEQSSTQETNSPATEVSLPPVPSTTTPTVSATIPMCFFPPLSSKLQLRRR